MSMFNAQRVVCAQHVQDQRHTKDPFIVRVHVVLDFDTANMLTQSLALLSTLALARAASYPLVDSFKGANFL